MKLTSKVSLLLTLALSFSVAAEAQSNQHSQATGLTVPNKSYTAAVDFSNAPERKTEKYPLSDQGNEGKWIKDKRFSDEFDGRELNTEIWRPSARGWKGRPPTYFHSSNISVGEGYLQFRVNKHGDEVLPEEFTHTSGFVSSLDRHLYGYYEARLKPNNSPWVTGFWMAFGDKEWWTEIDICENCPFTAGRENELNSNVHVFRAPEDKGDVKKHFAIGKKYYIPFRLNDDFHTWGLEWTKEYIRFYIDGVLFREQENTHWHQPLNININNESNKWFGALPDDNHLDEVYLVDYVRIWRQKPSKK